MDWIAGASGLIALPEGVIVLAAYAFLLLCIVIPVVIESFLLRREDKKINKELKRLSLKDYEGILNDIMKKIEEDIVISNGLLKRLEKGGRLHASMGQPGEERPELDTKEGHYNSVLHTFFAAEPVAKARSKRRKPGKRKVGTRKRT